MARKSKTDRRKTTAPEGVAGGCVAIGAAAAGLDSLSNLFARLPADTGASFVVTLHRDGLPASLALGAIAKASPMPVALAEDGAALEPDHAYLARDAELVTVEKGRLRVRPASPSDSTLIVTPASIAAESSAGRLPGPAIEIVALCPPARSAASISRPDATSSPSTRFAI